MIRSLKRPELDLLAARVGLSVSGKAHDGTTTITFLAGERPIADVVGLRDASVWLHGYVSAVVQIDPRLRREPPEWLDSP